jgi:mono/diheme cytochrome c family protein
MFHSGLMANAVLVLAVLLALFVGPAPLGAEANLTEAAQPQEEWWFWWYSALLAILPPEIAPTFTVLFPVVVFVGLLLLPFVDRSPKRGMRSRPAFVVGVVVTVLLLLYLTDLRRRSPWTGTPAAAPPPVPANVALNDVAEQGRRLFAAYGCNSCHPVAGVGPRIGPDLAQVERRYSPDEIRKYVVAPPEGVAMPSYAGRLSAEDLDRIVEYVHVAQTFPRRP